MFVGRSLFVAVCVLLAVAGCAKNPGGSAVDSAAPASPTPTTSASENHPLPPERLTQSDIKLDIASGAVQDVFIGSENITKFGPNEIVYYAAVSPSGRYMFVWHMDRSPRKLSIYDLQTHRKICTFVPGYGGNITWADHDLIYHQWGAGTNICCFRVYDTKGKTLWEDSATGAELCESGKYVIVFPSTHISTHGVRILDIQTGNVLAQAKPAGIGWVSDFRWIDGLTMRFWYETESGETKSVDVRLDADHPQTPESVDAEEATP